jgi:hypothetical protein
MLALFQITIPAAMIIALVIGAAAQNRKESAKLTKVAVRVERAQSRVRIKVQKHL